MDQMSEFEPLVARKRTVDPSGEIAQRPVTEGAGSSAHETQMTQRSSEIADATANNRRRITDHSTATADGAHNTCGQVVMQFQNATQLNTSRHANCTSGNG